MDARAQPPRQLVRMRGRSYVAFVFSPVVPIVGWLEEIDATLARSPGFFEGKPVVLDLSAVDLSQTAIAHLVSSLDQRNIRILGIEGVEASHLTSSMPPLLTGGRHCILAQNEPLYTGVTRFFWGKAKQVWRGGEGRGVRRDQMLLVA